MLAVGNPARGDDGLGPAVAEALEALALQGVSVEANYQLTVEDAAAVAAHDVVVFVDAAASGPEPFSFRRVAARRGLEYTSHGIEPSRLMGLAEELNGRSFDAWLLAVRGHRFEMFDESMSAEARANLAAALAFLKDALRERRFAEHPAPG